MVDRSRKDARGERVAWDGEVGCKRERVHGEADPGGGGNPGGGNTDQWVAGGGGEVEEAEDACGNEVAASLAGVADSGAQEYC